MRKEALFEASDADAHLGADVFNRLEIGCNFSAAREGAYKMGAKPARHALFPFNPFCAYLAEHFSKYAQYLYMSVYIVEKRELISCDVRFKSTFRATIF